MHFYASIEYDFGFVMESTLTQSISELVRKHVAEVYLRPAIRIGQKTFSVNAGAVHKALSLDNRVPLVCLALKSKKLLEENRLRIVSRTGPPSGQSTTVTFTYEILAPVPAESAAVNPLFGLCGIAKDVFKELGGGENFIRRERSLFDAHREK
jgi:hypothetical protein